MAELEQSETISSGISEEEEEEVEFTDEVEEEEYDEIVEGEEEEEEDEDEEVVEEKGKLQKKRRCPRKKKPCCTHKKEAEKEDDEEEEEDDEEHEEYEEKDTKETKPHAEDEEEEDEEEEEESESELESDILSTGFSVLSAVSFIWENNIYEFEELCDPGNIETILQKRMWKAEPEEYDDYGINRYLQLCTDMKIAPMISVLRFLKTDEIDLSYRNMTSNNLKALCGALEINSTVNRLIMKYNKLKVEDCLWIGLIMRQNENISYLDFTGCRIGPQGLELIIAHFLQYDNLVHLNLSKCNIEDEGMKSLAYYLMTSTKIQEVDLSHNKLGEESAGALGWVFKSNNTITDLNLRFNNLFDPTPMKPFLRYLSTGSSITRLDLSWNGLNGEEMGKIIGSFLRKSISIEHLDLSDNRFQGIAVIEIQRGLSKSKSLKVLKMGKNPMSPKDAEKLLLGAKWCGTLEILDLEDLWVDVSFVKNLERIQREKDIKVVFEGVLGDYTILGPDYPKLIFQRAQFEAQKPKKKKKKRNFGDFIWSLGDEPMPVEDFMLLVKKFKAKINKELYPELINQFKFPKSRLIDVAAMREKYLSIFPDSEPPLVKPKKKEKVPAGRAKGRRLEAQSGKKDRNSLVSEFKEQGEIKEGLVTFGENEIETQEENEEDEEEEGGVDVEVVEEEEVEEEKTEVEEVQVEVVEEEEVVEVEVEEDEVEGDEVEEETSE